MRTALMVDGKLTYGDDEMTGEQITEFARPSNDQFPVIVRNNGNLPERIPIQKSKHLYRLNDGDVITSMYRVPNGG